MTNDEALIAAIELLLKLGKARLEPVPRDRYSDSFSIEQEVKP
jgi:hypothetical protein